jgi:hypothetical protein
MSYYDDETTVIEKKAKALEILREWVAALRSGEYTQGKSFLHTELFGEGSDQFCCVGVLCKIASDRGNPLVARVAPGNGLIGYGEGRNSFDMQESVIPIGFSREIRDLMGEDAPEIDWTTLYEMNDEEGATFPDLADVIEREYIRPLEAQIGV